MEFPDATKSVIRVGEGRGFIVDAVRLDKRLVLTAAHCLPHLPPAIGSSYSYERTYVDLLGPLGGEATAAAECLFVDPVSDIAVLGMPDGQTVGEKADAYDNLIDALPPLPVRPAPQRTTGLMLSLNQTWFACDVEHIQRGTGPLIITKPEMPIQYGMSGSPILAEDKSAIGIICLFTENDDGATTIHGPNTRYL